MKIRFLPDEPIITRIQDRLGFSDFVELLKESIYNTQTPFVYGIIGDWGVGKTSILKLLQSQITDDLNNTQSSFVPIWFNAWKYENEANLIYPLLHAIKRDYISRIGGLDYTKGFWKKFLDVVATSTMAITDVGLRVATKQLTGEALKLNEINEQLKEVRLHHGNLEQALSSWADEVTKLDKVFEELLDSYARELATLKTPKKDESDFKFVIIIDDLDRCLPETAITILENIKNFLAVQNCIFVFGLNSDVIYQGIRLKYKGAEVNGREYLEKILNYSFYVPDPELPFIASFAAGQLEQLVLDEKFNREYRHCFLELGSILEECKFNNPRKIKRILNRYLFFIGKNHHNYNKYHNSNIVRFIILAEYYPRLFQLYLKNEETIRVITKDFEKLGEASFDMKKFEEKYGVQILRDYPRLSKMSKLFKINMDTTMGKLNPVEQAQDVFELACLV